MMRMLRGGTAMAAALAVVAVACRAQGAGETDARAALLAGRYDAALEAYRRLTEERPTAPAPSRGLVVALTEVGRYDEAVAAAERFRAAAPGSPELEVSLGRVLALTGRRTEAESAFTRAVERGATDSLTARLELAVLRHRRGEVEAARRAFDHFITVYNRGTSLTSEDLTAVATAVRHLAAYDPELAKDALRAYDEAIAADSVNFEPAILAGELLLERYNGTEARMAFEGVLARNPNHPRALVGLARTLRFEGSPAAGEMAGRSLEVNPNLVPARVFVAQLDLELERYGEAEDEAERALAVDPSSLEALAVLAAARHLRGDTAGFARARSRALALNPRYDGLYTTMAELSARNRLYQDAVRFAREAVTLDSVSWRGYALLGINELRVGAMDHGRRHLEIAFRGNPYDVWTKNTLDLLDALDRYPETTTQRFRVFVHERESELLGPYVAALAEEAYDSLARRYGTTVPTPIRIEMFPHHADFSVRTVGLVGLGALGVSFGPVIAMDSPSAPEVGEFNWGSTLWHELAHSFHLAMSDSRVPRWFSEGLAVYEERRARPGWGDDVSPAFLVAYKEGRLRAVSDLNEGFVRPAYPEQLAFSYYQASLVCEMIEREHGSRALLQMLRHFRDGRSAADVFQAVLHTDPATLDRRFTEYLETRFQGPLGAALLPGSSERPARVPPTSSDYLAVLAMGRRLARDGAAADAIPFLERAKELFPQYAGADSPYWYLAQIHRRRGALRDAARELAAMTAINARHYQAFWELAEILEELGDDAGAVRALEGAVYVSPMGRSLHERLATLNERLDRPDAVVRARRAILAIGPSDPARARYDLARAYLAAGDLEEARRWVLRALEDAPGFDEAQALLLRIHEGRNNR